MSEEDTLLLLLEPPSVRQGLRRFEQDREAQG